MPTLGHEQRRHEVEGHAGLEHRGSPGRSADAPLGPVRREADADPVAGAVSEVVGRGRPARTPRGRPRRPRPIGRRGGSASIARSRASMITSAWRRWASRRPPHDRAAGDHGVVAVDAAGRLQEHDVPRRQRPPLPGGEALPGGGPGHHQRARERTRCRRRWPRPAWPPPGRSRCGRARWPGAAASSPATAARAAWRMQASWAGVFRMRASSITAPQSTQRRREASGSAPCRPGP